MATKIYFIRHGAVRNPKGIFYGRLPRMTASDEGKMQIEQAAEYLMDKQISRVFASNLLRSRQGAVILRNKLNLPKMLQSQYITEVDSYMEGMLFNVGKLNRFDHYFSSLRKPENETMENVLERMRRFIQKVVKKFPGKSIAVVGHGDPIMILSASIKGLPMELDSIRTGKVRYIAHGEIYLVEVDGNGKLSVKSVFQPE